MTEATRLIKKYPNRRLYDTKTSTYITLVDIKTLVVQSEAFEVIDAKTGENLTRSILLQIILEEEAGGAPMFTADVLAQMIRFYGNAMQGMLGKYLENNIKVFSDMQGKLKDQASTLYGGDPAMNKDMWAQFVNFQGPAMQNMMGTYVEQSQKMFQQMQDSMQDQTRKLFGGFQFPNFTPPGTDKNDNSSDKSGGEKK
jgi:polyhydroxyalkanoate synthesis repressor PhaR